MWQVCRSTRYSGAVTCSVTYGVTSRVTHTDIERVTRRVSLLTPNP